MSKTGNLQVPLSSRTFYCIFRLYCYFIIAVQKLSSLKLTLHGNTILKFCVFHAKTHFFKDFCTRQTLNKELDNVFSPSDYQNLY